MIQPGDKPVDDVVITDSGEVSLSAPFEVTYLILGLQIMNMFTDREGGCQLDNRSVRTDSQMN